MSTSAEARTPPTGARRSASILGIQAINSGSSVVQMGLFAIAMPRSSFDEYSIWFTSFLLLVGIGQAVGSERVLIGRRTHEAGRDSAQSIAFFVCAAQLVVAAALASVPLALCSVAALAFVSYDYERLIRCWTHPGRYLRQDIVVLITQVAVTLCVWRLAGDSAWLALAWWIPAMPLWLQLSPVTFTRALAGLGVLRDDRWECRPLLLDSVLSGVPLFGMLTLVHVQGQEGDASAARMALTILGPLSVMGLAARRVIFTKVAEQTLTRRFLWGWSAFVVGTAFSAVGLLALTRTPLYPFLLPGFEALSWGAIVGFAVNHAAVFAAYLPAAALRRQSRSATLLMARAVATVGAATTAVVFMPVDDPAAVAWSVGVSSLCYSALLMMADRRLDLDTQAPATGQHS